jgi:hypothetical protein
MTVTMIWCWFIIMAPNRYPNKGYTTDKKTNSTALEWNADAHMSESGDTVGRILYYTSSALPQLALFVRQWCVARSLLGGGTPDKGNWNSAVNDWPAHCDRLCSSSFSTTPFKLNYFQRPIRSPPSSIVVCLVVLPLNVIAVWERRRPKNLIISSSIIDTKKSRSLCGGT